MLKIMRPAIGLCAVTFIGLPAFAFDSSDWVDARPASIVAVTPAPAQGQYLVSVGITDLVTRKVLAEPRLLTAAGVPATVEIGATDKVMVKFVVTVAASGREAAYISEVRRNGQVESTHSATIAIAARS